MREGGKNRITVTHAAGDKQTAVYLIDKKGTSSLILLHWDFLCYYQEVLLYWHLKPLKLPPPDQFQAKQKVREAVIFTPLYLSIMGFEINPWFSRFCKRNGGFVLSYPVPTSFG